MASDLDPALSTEQGTVHPGPRSPSTLGVEDTAGGATAPTRAPMAPGQAFGRYVVLGPLGRGGMGMVWRAYDEALDRAIALKLLHPGSAERHAKRLTREAQALAKLSHSNVVHVYEVGEVDGQWFIAMELVRGQTLRQWQEDAHDWREVVEVYRGAGAGLVAAHEAGLVHRDFKPDNCIIDEAGQPKVLDFGLVRDAGGSEVHEHAGFVEPPSVNPATAPLTRDGAVLGTLAYMPLEQLDGSTADARSDQFSFCVSLYEGLYGERPFEDATIGELTTALVKGDVRSAPKGSRVPGKLRKVVLRGLAADPDHRWPTMQALLDELQRVVTPRRSWVPVLVVGTALVGIGLWASGRESSTPCQGAEAQLEHVWDVERKQELEVALLGTALPYAADTWARIEPALDEYAESWVQTHTQACLATNVRKEQSTEVLDLEMGCLHHRRLALREAVEVLAHANSTRLQAAVSLVSRLPPLSRCEDIEALRAQLPPPQDAVVAERVEALRERLVTIQSLYLAAEYGQGTAQIAPLVEEAIALDYPPLMAEAWFMRGKLRTQQGDYVAAEQDLRRTFLLATELGHPQLEVDASAQLTFVVGTRRADSDQGLWWGDLALALSKRAGDQPREVAYVRNLLGTVFKTRGEYDEALEHHREAVALLEQAPVPDDLLLSSTLNNIGVVLDAQHEFESALDYYRRGLTIRQRALGPGHPFVANSLHNIGSSLAGRGEYAAALEHYRRSMAIWSGVLDPLHPHIAGGLLSIGAALYEQDEYDEALDSYRRSLNIWEQTVGPAHPTYARTLSNIGQVLVGQGRLDEAQQAQQRALSILEHAHGVGHPDVAMSRDHVARVLYRKGDLDGASREHERALAIREQALGSEHPLVASSLVGLAEVTLARGDHTKAREHAERAVAIREGGDGRPSQTAMARLMLARALWPDPSQRARALAQVLQARAMLIRQPEADELTLARLDAWLDEHGEG